MMLLGECMFGCVWMCVCLCLCVMVLDDASFVDGVASAEYTLIKFYAPFV